MLHLTKHALHLNISDYLLIFNRSISIKSEKIEYFCMKFPKNCSSSNISNP